MLLSEDQRRALSDYLSRNPLTCAGCGKDAWEFGEIGFPIAEVYVEPRKIEPSQPYVELTCKSCGHSEAVDCTKAGIPD